MNPRVWFHSYGKVVSLLVTMILGALFPSVSALSFLVQYFLMIMLFLSFLNIELKASTFPIRIAWILLANVLVALAAYLVFSIIGYDMGITAFITGIAPTAISSTVIISFIEGKVDFMVTAVLLSNISMALLVPFILPFILETNIEISTWGVLRPVLITMFVPLVLAFSSTYFPKKIRKTLVKGKRLTFPIWLINLFIISAKASDFILHENTGSWIPILQIAGISFVICVLNFSLGAWIGGKEYWQEASQALGQKNNSFAIWIALTFINPLAAMGPTFYILFHNIYNTWQIYRFEKRNEETLWN